MIHIFTGPMGGGKTEALVRAVRAFPGKVLAFKPTQDTRQRTIRGRDGGNLDAQPIRTIRDAAELFWAAKRRGEPVAGIAIDEIHMLARQHGREDIHAWEAFVVMAEACGVELFLAGLDTGHEGHKLQPIAHLANFLSGYPAHRMLHWQLGTCDDCGPGCHSAMSWMVEDAEEPVVGDLGKEYKALCERRFFARLRERIAAREARLKERQIEERDAHQGKAAKLVRLFEEAVVSALGSQDSERRTHAADTLGRLEALLGEVELLGVGARP